jgi:hypothetical protein
VCRGACPCALYVTLRRGTRWDRVGQDGMRNPRKIKRMVGNDASCFRFFHSLGQGPNPFPAPIEEVQAAGTPQGVPAVGFWSLGALR